MIKWWVWECNGCGDTYTTNRFVDEEKYEEIKDCERCEGQYEYKREYEE